MHHLEANKSHGETARCELSNNATFHFEQFMEETLKRQQTAVYFLSQKPSKCNKEHVWGIAVEEKSNS